MHILKSQEDIYAWDKKIGNKDGYNDYSETAYLITIDKNNNVYVTGLLVTLDSFIVLDWYIKKFDSNGIEDTSNWNKKFSSNGSYDDMAYSIVIDSNNNVYVAGYGYNLVNASSGYDWWIKKFDLEW